MSLHPDFSTSPYAPLVPEQRWFPADEALRSTAYEKLLPPLVAKIRQEVFAWRDGGYTGASPTSLALLRWWFDTDHLLENADGSRAPFRYYFAQREAVETAIWLYEVRGARDKFDLLCFDASGAVSTGWFDEAWPRYVLKMATGAGKTKVISLLIAWSFFHKLYEPDSTLSRNFLVIAPNTIFSKIVGESGSGGLELKFAAFLRDAGDVGAFAKNYLAVGFKLDYVKADGDLSTYTPDFIVKTGDGTIWIVETKGCEELDLPQKMARLRQWCADATAAGENGQRYDFVFMDQDGFDRHRPRTFATLVASFTEYKL